VRRLASWAGLTHRPRLRPHHPARSHFQDACAGGTGRDRGPAGTATCSTAARTPCRMHTRWPRGRQAWIGQYAVISTPANTRRGAHQPPLAPPTSPTPELAHMAVRL